MDISRVSDKAQELPVGDKVGNVASRQRSDTSDPSGDSSRAPVSKVNAPSYTVKVQERKNASMKSVDIQATVEKLNQFIKSQRQDVAFSVDEEAHTTVIKFFKTDTGELIKQFTPEQILAMKAKLRKFNGWLVDKKL